MLQIIPNWHPIFVHFTVALFTTTTAFYLFSYLIGFLKGFSNKVAIEFEVVGHWCLWLVAMITIGTVLAGLYAFNTVRHDEAGHIAMTIHRNLALTTATGIVLLAIWSGWRYYKSTKTTIVFLLGLLIVQVLLISTAWLGGELVFRHGLGVMAMPKEEGEGHHHHHDGVEEPSLDHPNMPNMENHEHHVGKE
ncbi:MAG: DUF2231 domain-containing protein [Gammaproteobacteria bacterium]